MNPFYLWGIDLFSNTQTKTILGVKTGLLLIFVLLLISNSVQCQLDWGIEVKPKIGLLIGKRAVVGDLPRAHPFAGEVSFVIHTKGEKLWHKHYVYPTVGVTAFAASVGNNNVLGNFYGSYGFIEFPFVKEAHYQFTGKIGSGLAYTSHVYDPLIDPKNSVVSAHVNALICFGLQNRFVFDRHQIILGIDLTHCSNGSYKVPNIGINMPYISLGYGYRFRKSEVLTKHHSVLPYRKILWGLTGIISSNDNYPTGQNHAPVYALSGFARYFFRPKVGAEMALDVNSEQLTLRYKPEISKTQLDIIQVGVYAGYLLPLDRFHFVLGMGVNVRDKYKPESLFYHRIGMRYYLDNGIHLNVVLRSNWAKANYTEWGIGYTFNYRNKNGKRKEG